MRILTLFLALFLTWLPESIPYVNTTSDGQVICFEDVCDVEEEAVLRAPRRASGEVQILFVTVQADRKPVFISFFPYHPLPFCFERLWLAARTLRL